MKAFAELYANLDATTSSNAKLAALQSYFRQAPPADAAWAVYFLSGGRPRQLCRRGCYATWPPRLRASNPGCSKKVTNR